jgi:hypothetical protein
VREGVHHSLPSSARADPGRPSRQPGFAVPARSPAVLRCSRQATGVGRREGLDAPRRGRRARRRAIAPRLSVFIGVLLGLSGGRRGVLYGADGAPPDDESRNRHLVSTWFSLSSSLSSGEFSAASPRDSVAASWTAAPTGHDATRRSPVGRRSVAREPVPPTATSAPDPRSLVGRSWVARRAVRAHRLLAPIAQFHANQRETPGRRRGDAGETPKRRRTPIPRTSEIASASRVAGETPERRQRGRCHPSVARRLHAGRRARSGRRSVARRSHIGRRDQSGSPELPRWSPPRVPGRRVADRAQRPRYGGRDYAGVTPSITGAA